MTEITITSSDKNPQLSPDYAITSHDLGHRYGRQWAVRHLDLKVPRGSIYGFLGLNGAGKSTTIRMMLGLIRPHEGRLMVAGANPATNDIDVKRRVGYVPDTPAFYDWMTVEETCALVAHYRKDRWDTRIQRTLLNDFELNPAARTSSLSKGQKARLSLVLALAFNPEILILDEPTLGLDAIARRQFSEGILKEFAGEGKTVFFSSHLINEIAGIVDYVGILKDGGLLLEEPVEDLRARFRRIELQFDSDAPPQWPGDGRPWRYTAAGREAVIIDDGKVSLTNEALETIGATSHRTTELSLEELFIELVGKHGAPK